jgi:hypothetical protein
MTKALEGARCRFASPRREQDELAAAILEDLAADERWEAALAQSQWALERLAAEVLDEPGRSSWGRKHPALVGHEDAVRTTLTDPDEIRRSKRDPNVFLFYRGQRPRWVCAVVRRENGEGFLDHRVSNRCHQGRGGAVDKIKVIHDTVAHTLTVWLDDPRKEHICEETTDEVVLMKDADGRVIGVELLHYRPADMTRGLAVETVVLPGA